MTDAAQMSSARLGPGGHWRNWVGNQSFIARHKAEPGSEDELAALVREASRQYLPIRVAGSGHSFTPVVATAGLLLSLKNMQGLVSADSIASASSCAQARGLAISAAFLNRSVCRCQSRGYRYPGDRRRPFDGHAWRRNRAWLSVVPGGGHAPGSARRISAKLRRAVRTRGHFPTDEAATKLLFLVLREAAGEWKMPPREWFEAKTQFAIMFDERFVQA